MMLLDKNSGDFYHVGGRLKVYTLMIRKYVIYAGIIAAGLIIVLSGCEKPDIPVQKVGGFAIYLAAQSVETSQLAKMDIDSIPREDMPVITMDDIISYSRDTHEIELSSSAYDRLMQMGVPVDGRPFVVCLDGKPVYAGAFWVKWSSLCFDGVVIMLPSLTGTPVIQLSPGYPDPGFFKGKDPRSNKKIFRSLEVAGKLKQEEG